MYVYKNVHTYVKRDLHASCNIIHAFYFFVILLKILQFIMSELFVEFILLLVSTILLIARFKRYKAFYKNSCE